MVQNTSSAVMAQRTGARAPHSLAEQFAAACLNPYLVDDFPTPPWGGRAWCEHVIGPQALAEKVVWEPAANRGFLARGLADYCKQLVCSDIFDYGVGYPTFDFLDLSPDFLHALPPGFLVTRPDWIVTNPPFARAGDFIATALAVATEGVAMLCRVQTMETSRRYARIFKPLGGRWAWSQFVERLPMAEGRCERKINTASAYGWLTIWQRAPAPEFILGVRHIPPCRRQLERSSDYTIHAAEKAALPLFER